MKVSRIMKSTILFGAALGWLTFCHQKSFNSIETSGFQTYLETISHPISQADLPFLYQTFTRQEPAMSGATIEEWEENGIAYISMVNNLADDSVDKLKIAIGYQRTTQGFQIIEIRESWTCHIGRGHTSFSNKNCN